MTTTPEPSPPPPRRWPRYRLSTLLWLIALAAACLWLLTLVQSRFWLTEVERYHLDNHRTPPRDSAEWLAWQTSCPYCGPPIVNRSRPGPGVHNPVLILSQPRPLPGQRRVMGGRFYKLPPDPAQRQATGYRKYKLPDTPIEGTPPQD